jgi:hypothetical protein
MTAGLMTDCGRGLDPNDAPFHRRNVVNTGRTSESASAATHSPCRRLADAPRSNRSQKAAAVASSATCQTAFIKKVSND